MFIYFFAGVFLLVAIIFVVKYIVDSKKGPSQLDLAPTDGEEITVVTDEELKKKKKSKKRNPKRDVIIALVCMILCEICILLGNYVIDI